MQRKPLAIFTLVLAALIAAWRVLLLPVAAGDGKALTHLNLPLFGVILVSALLLILLGRAKSSYAALSGRDARVVSLGGVLFAAALAATSVADLVRWLTLKIAPAPPVAAIAQKTDNVLLPLLLLFGIVSAVFLCSYFLKFAGGTTADKKSGVIGWLWLAPTLWMLLRLVRYNVLYATAVDVTPFAYEAVLCCVALLFLFAFGSYMSGARKTGRFLRGFAAATAALALGAVVSRAILIFMGYTVAAEYCSLTNGADLMLGVFALTVASTLSCEEPTQTV